MLATTDIPFRAICRDFGSALTCTEMVSAAGLERESSQSFRNAVITPDEHPVAMQIVAADPARAVAAVQTLLPRKPDLFDLNCGCPNERICDAGAGAGLLDNLPRFGAVIEGVVRASPIPVTVKVRARGANAQSNVRDIVRTASDSGATMVTVHARTRNTAYEVSADWQQISDAVAAADVPVIGNGDVFCAADAFRMMEETGCHAVMVARGALGTPWIFRDIAEHRRCDLDEYAPDGEDLLTLVQGHVTALQREFGPVLAVPRIRKHVLWYARRHDGFDSLRMQLFSTDNADTVAQRALRHFSDLPTLLDPEDPIRHEREDAFRRRVLFWTEGRVPDEG